MPQQIKLGDLLIQHAVITEAQLQEALQEQKKTGERLGQTLINLHYLTEQQFLDFFSKQLNIPFFDLKQYQVDPALNKLLPESYARLYHAIILGKNDNGFLLGMVDPLNLMAIDKLNHILKERVQLALVKEEDLNRVLDLSYRRTEEITGFAQELSQELGVGALSVAEETNLVDAPVIKLLESLFQDAVQVNASDIHIEPTIEGVIFRLRVDGILQEQKINEKSIMPAIASRLKLMAGLNIAEKRIPQDGRFSLVVRNKKFDIRLSTMPTPFGESIVLRLLRQDAGILQLEQTGMAGEILTEFRRLLQKPNGIILVTGPTGSGKSTTLYAALNEINKPEIQIITVEDPIEYFLPWAVQIQTNEKIGLDFATVLRSILRHDPDVILVGEMRDKETSSIAIRAALTGRLVLSTLHTNDAVSSISRLQDLGVESYLISATTQAILAQRLVRIICPNCKEPHQPMEEEKAWFSKLKIDLEHHEFKQGKGCSFCSNTGYHGRTGIFELLEFNEPMAEALRNNDQNSFHHLAQQSLEGKLLINDAYRLAIQGGTTLQEIMRAVNEGY